MKRATALQQLARLVLIETAKAFFVTATAFSILSRNALTQFPKLPLTLIRPGYSHPLDPRRVSFAFAVAVQL